MATARTSSPEKAGPSSSVHQASHDAHKLRFISCSRWAKFSPSGDGFPLPEAGAAGGSDGDIDRIDDLRHERNCAYLVHSIVSTGLGSTGWLRSVLTGAAKVVSAAAGTQVSLADTHELPWDADHLYYSVREPFPSRATGTSIVFGRVTPTEPLTVVSNMPENGVIFSDGIERDFLAFNSGVTATVTVAAKRGRLVK